MKRTLGPSPLSIRTPPRLPLVTIFVLAIALFLRLATLAFAQSSNNILPGPKPPDTPLEWKQLVGIYADEPKSIQPLVESKRSLVLLEQDGQLFLRDDQGKNQKIVVHDETVFLPSEGKKLFGHDIVRDEAEHIVAFCYLNFCFRRTDPGSDPSRSDRVTPSRPVATLRSEALAATPPQETGNFRKPDLVELAPLDRSIHLDIRYATSNDFLGAPVYSQ